MNPLVRINTECGKDNYLAFGREPCQGGWYNWCGEKFCKGKTVLDIGAGMCEGIPLLEKAGAKSVHGQDIDPKLAKLTNKLIIGDILNFPPKSYDVLTCFDVIEHVIHDTSFFLCLCEIARETIIITTPNFTRSKALNHCHCREYTIPQFANCFLPSELWSASPDGRIHHTLLLKQAEGKYIDMTRENKTYPIKEVPVDISFTHSTVDGNEWPHMCGIFRV